MKSLTLPARRLRSGLSTRFPAVSLSAFFLCVVITQSAFAYTPEQTVAAWVAAIKRNDVKAAMLLGTTPEQYIALSDDLANEYTDTPESNLAFAKNFEILLAPDAVDRIFVEVQPSLVGLNVYRDSFAEMGNSMLAEMGTNADAEGGTALPPDQLAAAREVFAAFQGWSMRTDFSDEKRARAAIVALVTAFRAVNVRSASDWAKLSNDGRIEKLSFALVAVKDILKAYDLNLDKLLGSIAATPGKQTADEADVRIAYRVFEARGSAVIEMFQRGGEWFFWREIW